MIEHMQSVFQSNEEVVCFWKFPGPEITEVESLLCSVTKKKIHSFFRNGLHTDSFLGGSESPDKQ